MYANRRLIKMEWNWIKREEEEEGMLKGDLPFEPYSLIE